MTGLVVQNENVLNTLSTSLDSIIKAEDSVHASGDKGIMSLGVINTLSSIFGAEGDYAPLKLGRSGELYVNNGTLIYSDVVVDVNYTAFERRCSYNNTTGAVTITYKAVDGSAGVPVGSVVFPEELMMTFMDDIWSKIINVGTEEAVAIGNFSRLAVGGKTVTATGYIPNFGTDESMMLAMDAVTGRALIQDDKIEATQGTQNIQSTSTAFVPGTAIDLRCFQRISLFPEVITNAGTTADYKIQWSFDANNWFDETIDTPGASGTGEIVLTQDTMIRRFDSSALAVISTASVTLDKKARYVRISQRSAAADIIQCTYRYQLLRN